MTVFRASHEPVDNKDDAREIAAIVNEVQPIPYVAQP